jgi:hypothetical protein
MAPRTPDRTGDRNKNRQRRRVGPHEHIIIPANPKERVQEQADSYRQHVANPKNLSVLVERRSPYPIYFDALPMLPPWNTNASFRLGGSGT